MSNAARKTNLSLIVRIGVAVGAILWVCHGQDWGELATVFRRVNPWYFVLSLVVFGAAQTIMAARWWLLLRAIAIRISVPAIVRLHFLGLFYNNVMPGAVGGDLLRAWYVTKHTDKRLMGALSVFMDRLVGLSGMVAMAATTWLLFVRGRFGSAAASAQTGTPGWLEQHTGVLLGSGLAIVAALASMLTRPAIRAALRRRVARISQKVHVLLAAMRDAAVAYCLQPSTMGAALVLTVVAQSVVVRSLWLLGCDLGLVVALRYYFVLFPAMWVVAAVPVSIAGLGVFEAGMVAALEIIGTPRELAVALALCQRLIWVLAALPGGIIHLLGAHVPKSVDPATFAG